MAEHTDSLCNLFLKDGVTELQIPTSAMEEIVNLNLAKLARPLKGSLTGKRLIPTATLTPDYYQTVSALGIDIIGEFGLVLLDDCRSTIEHWHSLGYSFYVCSALKYLWRLGNKGGSENIASDLLKAITNLTWELESEPANSQWHEKVSSALKKCQLLFKEQQTPDYWNELQQSRQALRKILLNSPVFDPLQDGKSKLQLIDVMGLDLSVVNDARASFNKISTNFEDRDRKLLTYLYSSKPPHSSPFRGCVLKFRITAPLACCRQFWKHAVASSHVEDQLQHNECSFRYTEVTEPVFYQPDVYYRQAANNRQASGEELDRESNEVAKVLVDRNNYEAFNTYQELLKLGVSRERARDVLPPSTYTTWVWTTSLQALLNFVELRTGEGAQSEIQKYAQVCFEILQHTFPEVAALKTRPKELETEFEKLALAWKSNTAHLSSLTAIHADENYQAIIALGKPVLPSIFKSLLEVPDDWFFALAAITGTDPVPSDADYNFAVLTWLQWGHKHGYL
jgi:thymidylate synthase (FAD)